MTAAIEIFTGAALSDRAEQLDAFLVESLPGARMLVPTRDYARQRMHDMVRRGLVSGILGRPILTFQDFVEDLLRGTTFEQEHVDEGAQRILLERIVADMARAGELDAIGPAARTPGFIAHLHRTIAQLKQSAIDPAQFARTTEAAGRRRETDRVVGRAYAAYQDALKAAHAYDTQGTYWMADLACAESLPESLAHIKVLILDGFDDFTESEFRLVRTLARHLDTIVFGLVVDLDRSPEDQGRLVRQTFALIENSFDFAHVNSSESPEPLSRIEHASLHLFGRAEEFPKNSLLPNIRMIECYNPRHEAEVIAGEIKRAVRDGHSRLDGIAVVHANAGGVAGRYRSVFRRYGIPCSMRGGESLDACGVGAYARGIFKAIESWSREDVLEVLASPYAGADPHNVFDGITRAAGIVQGREQWAERVERFQQQCRRSDPSYDAPLDHVPDLEDQCSKLIEAVRRLERVADAFPNPCRADTLAGWVAAALDNLGVPDAMERFDDEARERARAERSALDNALRRLKRWYGEDSIERSEAARLVRQCLSDANLPYKIERGGVWFGKPEDIRHLNFDLVFCAEMNEGVWPSKPFNNAIYGEQERTELAGLGIRLRDANWDSHRQTGLFQRIFDCAREELILTWPMTGAAGDALERSPFIEDLQVLFDEIPIEQLGTPSHSVLPDADRCASAREARNLILDARLSGDFDVSGLAAARDGAEVERRRYSSTAFDEYDGCLSDPSVIERLNLKYDARHLFSASAINTFLQCPFRFFMERELHVKTLEAPDEAFDPLLRGLIMHRALETFYSSRRGIPLNQTSGSDSADLERAVDDAFARWAWVTAQTPPQVVELERVLLLRRLERFIRWSAEDDANAEWAPMHLEAQFGRAAKPNRNTLSIPEPFEFDTPIGTVLIQGKIDRIDSNGVQLRIIDYKSGAPPAAAEIKAGEDVQLALYALAASRHLVPGSNVQSAWYWTPGKTSRSEGRRNAFKGQQWDAEEAILLATESVALAVEAMRAGKFGLRDSDKRCKGCPEGKVCRFEEGRVSRKLP